MFHWLIALHILGLIALGWWMVGLSFYSGWYHRAPELHKSFGISVFLLGLGMLVWHRKSKRPGGEPGHLQWEIKASKIAHIVLLASVLIIPLSGYVFTTSNGEGISVFGFFTIPALLSVSETMRNIAINFHIYASYGLLGVIGMHVGGALKHHFIDRDRTLRRMTY